MPDEMKRKLNISSTRPFLDSSIIRILIGLLIIALYGVFISPKFENVLSRFLANNIRNSSQIEINSLTPVFDIHVYAGEYNFSSSIIGNNVSSSTKFFTIDPRILALNKFLSDYHSPLASYAKDFITSADKYGLDWRLVASISGVESAFGNITPANSHNGWGWRGINKNDAGWSMFSSWPDGIEEITRGLAQGYGTDLSPFEIEPSYCPPCASYEGHAWANGVTRFMNELDYYINNLNNL